jgi:hypothetical protein
MKHGRGQPSPRRLSGRAVPSPMSTARLGYTPSLTAVDDAPRDRRSRGHLLGPLPRVRRGGVRRVRRASGNSRRTIPDGHLRPPQPSRLPDGPSAHPRRGPLPQSRVPLVSSGATRSAAPPFCPSRPGRLRWPGTASMNGRRPAGGRLLDSANYFTTPGVGTAWMAAHRRRTVEKVYSMRGKARPRVWHLAQSSVSARSKSITW